MKAFIILFSIVLMSACSSIEKSEETRHRLQTEPLQQAVTELGYIAQEPVERVVDWDLYNWQAIDDHAVIIWVNAFDPYLFTLRERCSQLNFADTISVTHVGNTINANFDAVIALDPPAGGEKCFIDKIYPLTKMKAQNTEHH